MMYDEPTKRAKKKGRNKKSHIERLRNLMHDKKNKIYWMLWYGWHHTIIFVLVYIA